MKKKRKLRCYSRTTFKGDWRDDYVDREYRCGLHRGHKGAHIGYERVEVASRHSKKKS